jgi:predicted DNA-binding transcriptional regulator YafY
MSRNSEVVRQWTVLQEIERSTYGQTIEDLAALTSRHPRTIRRDLEALQCAGFPVYDDVVDGKKRWKLNGKPFGKLTGTSFTLSELCAIYFSRSLLEALAGAPFRDDLGTAFAKIEGVLSPAMRAFLDRLPAVLVAKAAPRPPRQTEARYREVVAKLRDASLHNHCVEVLYHSLSSRREKVYRLEPYQVIFGQGALYLIAYVPEYHEFRTFAMERVRRVTVLEQTFNPVKRPLATEVFGPSLGAFTGRDPVRVELEFDALIAPHVRERLWHPSQEVRELPGGRVGLVLHVSDDPALRQWVLSFGSLVRVLAPGTLVRDILDELDRARGRYQPEMELALPPVRLDSRQQRWLPFARATRPRTAPAPGESSTDAAPPRERRAGRRAG